MRHRAPATESDPEPMPEFPLLEMRMMESPAEMAKRWQKQMRDFKVAWDKWRLTQ